MRESNPSEQPDGERADERLGRSPLDASTAVHAAARAYIARGWRLLPCFSDKKPAIAKWQQAASVDAETAERWFGGNHPSELIGVATATSGLIVVDVDGAAGEASWRALLDEHDVDEPNALPAKTPRGRHLYFACPEGAQIRTRAGVRVGIDVRAGWVDANGEPRSAGYVIAPPGPGRHWLDHEVESLPRPPELPAWLLSVLVEDRPRTAAASPTTKKAKGDDWTTLLRDGAAKGSRNATAARIVGHYLAAGVAAEEVLTMALDWATRCRPPMNPDEVRRVVWSIAKADTRNHPSRSMKPQILLRAGELRETTTAAESALLADTSVEPLYQRGNQLARVVRADEPTMPRSGVVIPAHVPTIAPVGSTFLRAQFEQVVRFVRIDETGNVRPASCPSDVAACYQQSEGLWRLPILRAVVTAPTLRADGTVLQSPGYDSASKLLFDPAGITFPTIPDSPTREDARASVAQLLELVAHFSFASPGARSVWLASVITAVVRPLLPSAPMFLFDAPTRGSGKSKAAAIAGIVATGRWPATMTFVDDQDEARKRILALLLQGTAVVNIDNIDAPIGGATLCSVLTEPVFEDRVLGVSQTARVPTAMTWVGTGNNVVIVGDLTRRVLVCRIDPGCENPEDRQFPFDPVLLAEQRRPELVAAVLTLLRAHAVAGRPQCGLGAFGSFEFWSEVVRAAIVWAGEADPLLGRQAIVELDGGAAAIGALLTAWRARFGSDFVTTRRVVAEGGLDLLDAMEEVLGADLAPGNRGRMLGRKIAEWRDRIVAGLQFVQGGTAQGGVRRWGVVARLRVGSVG